MTLRVVVPAYNCFEWIERCLLSIANQEYKDYEVIVIDDASTDLRQPPFVKQFCGMRSWKYLLNAENKKCPYNIWRGIKELAPYAKDPIIIVDGDDFLPHPEVFHRILEVYSDEDVWLTYGNYNCDPFNTGQTPATAYPEHIIQNRSYREIGSLFNHIITFRHFLWDAIPVSELQDDEGNWFRVCYDRAIMIPMLEMCGDHFQFLNECLYTYNAVNPISDHITLQEEAQKTRNIINSRLKLELL